MIQAFIIAAQTIDGFIAKDKDHAATWTSKDDKKHFVELTKNAGVVVMGSRTFATLPKPLKERLNVVYTRSPEKLAAELADKIAGAENVLITDKPPVELLAELEAESHTSVAICGGAEIYSLFMETGLVTKLYITVEPVMFGTGISIFNKPLDSRWNLVNSTSTGGGTVFLEYDRVQD
jgi:dihydrofolate reductase